MELRRRAKGLLVAAAGGALPALLLGVAGAIHQPAAPVHSLSRPRAAEKPGLDSGATHVLGHQVTLPDDLSDELAENLTRAAETLALSLPPGATNLESLVSRLRVVRKDGQPVRARRTARELEVTLPGDRAITQDDRASLLIPFLSEAEKRVEAELGVHVVRGLTGICSNARAWGTRVDEPSDLEYARGILTVWEVLANRVPPGWARAYHPTIGLVRDPRDAEGSYGGRQIDACLLVDVGGSDPSPILIHEYAHFAQYLYGETVAAGWPDGTYREDWDYQHPVRNPHTARPGEVSAYASKNELEDFAETVEALLDDCGSVLMTHANDRTVQLKVRTVANLYTRHFDGTSVQRDALAGRWWAERCDGVDVRHWGKP